MIYDGIINSLNHWSLNPKRNMKTRWYNYWKNVAICNEIAQFARVYITYSERKFFCLQASQDSCKISVRTKWQFRPFGDTRWLNSKKQLIPLSQNYMRQHCMLSRPTDDLVYVSLSANRRCNHSSEMFHPFRQKVSPFLNMAQCTCVRRPCSFHRRRSVKLEFDTHLCNFETIRAYKGQCMAMWVSIGSYCWFH